MTKNQFKASMVGTLPGLKSEAYAYGAGFAGESLNNLIEILQNLISKKKPILFLGETGTGKENLAELCFELSGRKNFVPVNCAGFEEKTLISELFGHTKGAFTDAKDHRKGLLEEYGEDGLIFIDELGEAPIRFQAMLLRVIENGDFKPLGSNEIKKLDNLKIIAATSKMGLRSDLTYRFITLYVPGLSRRKKDIPLIISWYWKQKEDSNSKVEYISKLVIDKLKASDWPGNVRELINSLDIAETLCQNRKGRTLRLVDFTIFKFHDNSDSSRRLKIKNLQGGGKILPARDFFILPDSGNSIKPKPLYIEKKSEKSLSDNINFDATIPNEYKEQFWEHHLKKGRTARYIEQIFDGKIKSQTARKWLKKAKEKLSKEK